MQFKISDQVVHPTYGIGHIVDIEEKRFAQQESQWYYKVRLPKRTLWLPVETQEASGLRPITAKSELDWYRNLLKSPPLPLERNHHRRHPALLRRLKEGSFQVLCEVVRDLTAWGWRKPLGPTDMATLRKIRQSLSQEWATAAGVSPNEAIKEIDSLLLATRTDAIQEG
jgi:CarD family transcriptional regulator